MLPTDVDSDVTETTNLLTMPVRLSAVCKITCIAAGVVLIAVTGYLSPLAAMILPILFLPTIWLIWYHSTTLTKQHANSERLIWIYLTTAILGLPCIALLQAALLFPFLSLVFGSDQDFLWHEWETVKRESDIIDDDHRAKRAAFAARPSYWFFIFYMSFIIASGVEELLKYIMVRIGKQRQQGIHDTDYLMYGAVAGLSFATCENVGFLIEACQLDNSGRLLLTILERLGLGVPIHTICGMLTAAGLALQDRHTSLLGFPRVIMPSIFFHGLFDFVLFGYSAWAGNVGWIHPDDIKGTLFLLVCTVAVTMAAALSLRQRIAGLDLQS